MSGSEAAALSQLHLFPNRAVVRATDSALTPERITSTWMTRSDLREDAWGAAPGVRCIAAQESEGETETRTISQALRSSAPTVYLVGTTPASFAREWMGEYVREAQLAPSSPAVRKHPLYRHRGDRTRELRYVAHTGEWRVGRVDHVTGLFDHWLAAYDGALVPELINAPWRARGDIGWQDAPEVRCLSGATGKQALQADARAEQAASDLQRALTPGWFTWLFKIRAPAVLAQLKKSLQAGMPPARGYAILSKARMQGIDEAVIEAARQQLAMAVPPTPRLGLAQPSASSPQPQGTASTTTSSGAPSMLSLSQNTKVPVPQSAADDHADAALEDAGNGDAGEQARATSNADSDNAGHAVQRPHPGKPRGKGRGRAAGRSKNRKQRGRGRGRKKVQRKGRKAAAEVSDPVSETDDGS